LNPNADIGLIGLAVMGQNLALKLNMNDQNSNGVLRSHIIYLIPKVFPPRQKIESYLHFLLNHQFGSNQLPEVPAT
jgi:hypothetical protein